MIQIIFIKVTRPIRLHGFAVKVAVQRTARLPKTEARMGRDATNEKAKRRAANRNEGKPPYQMKNMLPTSCRGSEERETQLTESSLQKDNILSESG